MATVEAGLVANLRSTGLDVCAEAATEILKLRGALKSALGKAGVLDNDETMRREVWHDGRVASWTSAAMVESERKYDARIAPFGTYPCSRLPNRKPNPVSAQSPKQKP